MKIATCPPVLQRILRDPECFKEYVKYSAKPTGYLETGIAATLRAFHGCDRICDLRVWLALLELYEQREMLRKKLNGEGRRLHRSTPFFGLENIQRLTGLRERSIREALKRLGDRQLISSYHPCEVVFPVLPLTGPALDGLMAMPGRKRTGAVSIPRAILRWLCRHGTRSTIAVALAHCLRCWGSWGRCPRKFVITVFGLSRNSTKRGISALKSLGWLHELEPAGTKKGSPHPGRKRMKHNGPKTQINYLWKCRTLGRPRDAAKSELQGGNKGRDNVTGFSGALWADPGRTLGRPILPSPLPEEERYHPTKSRMQPQSSDSTGCGFSIPEDGRTDGAKNNVSNINIESPATPQAPKAVDNIKSFTPQAPSKGADGTSTLKAPPNLTRDDLHPRRRITLWKLCNATAMADRVLIDAACEHCLQPDVRNPPGLFRVILENRDIPVGVGEDGEIDTIKAREALTNHDEDEGIRKRKACEPKATLQPDVKKIAERTGEWLEEFGPRPKRILMPLSGDAQELQRVRVKKETGWRLQLQCQGWDMDRITRADKELECA